MKILATILALLASLAVQGAGVYNVSIKDQASFNRINDLVSQAVAKGNTEVCVTLSPGTYYFSERHLDLTGKQWPNVTLTITGQDCRMVSKGADYQNGSKFKGQFKGTETFIDDNFELVPIYSGIRHCSGKVDVVDEGKKLCRIKSSDLKNASRQECAASYIRLTEWYMSYVYKVEYIQDGYIYFTAGNLKKIGVGEIVYNVNYDMYHGLMLPRYKLCNVQGTDLNPLVKNGTVYVPAGTKKVHLCESGCFIDATECSLKKLVISNIAFIGNSDKADPALIRLWKLKCDDCEVCNCSFTAMKSHILFVKYTDNVRFHNNTVSNCLGFGIAASYGASNVKIEYNSFTNTGLDLIPSFCVNLSCDNYYVGHNTMKNFGYSGIAVGVGPQEDFDGRARGTVEYNELYYDEDYIKNIENYTLMDSGAIYLTTRHDGAVVRYNNVHDISGVKENRGIFCDDGARNFSIYGNTVLNIANSYSIDSRRVSAFEPYCGPTNVGNTIRDNKVNAPIRFEGRESSDKCKLGVNYLIKNKNGQYPGVAVKNVTSKQKAKKVK